MRCSNVSKCEFQLHLTHGGDANLECGEFFKTLSTKSNLKQHQFLYSKKRFECIGCKITFHLKFSLISHNRYQHTVVKQFPCVLYLKQLAIKGDRNRHFKSHTDMKPHQCTTCKK